MNLILKDPLFVQFSVKDLKFNNLKLLEQALTHRSFSKTIEHNERLEFLGDAILSFVIAEDLHERLPNAKEGILTQLRAMYVCKTNLAKAAYRLELGKILRTAKNLKLSGSVQQLSILADVVEALIGAIYLDQGLEAAKKFIFKTLGPIPSITDIPLMKSHKTELQELIQSKYSLAPRYEVVNVLGVAHAPIFKIRVLINNKEIATAEGSNKKEASEAAAQIAINSLFNDIKL